MSNAADPDGLQRFKSLVLEDSALQDVLRGCVEREAFVELVLAQASTRGCAVTEPELQNALNAGFHSWLTRGIDR